MAAEFRAGRMYLCLLVLADARRTGKTIDSWFEETVKADISILNKEDRTVEEWTEFWRPVVVLFGV